MSDSSTPKLEQKSAVAPHATQSDLEEDDDIIEVEVEHCLDSGDEDQPLDDVSNFFNLI